MRYDISKIKESCDLLSLVQDNCGPGKKVGRSVMFHCPFHEDNHPSLEVQPKLQLWHCFSCERKGDVIEWVKQRHNVSFPEACRILCGDSPHYKSSEKKSTFKKKAHPAYSPPDKGWQESVGQIVPHCKAQLWSPLGKGALEYLYTRGLVDKTIQDNDLGFSPGININGVYAPKGIVIPCRVAGNYWYVKIRKLLEADIKYLCVTQSKPSAIYHGDMLKGTRVALLCEGEFDCLIASQEIGHLLPCITTGSASNTLDMATWGTSLFSLKVVLAAYDNDEAGEKGFERFHDIMGSRAQRIVVPFGKDINDFFIRGGNLYEWIKPFIDATNVI